ncbi:TetR/AcrR family transcriptional regulator [Nocardiopsis sp. NRRL B-16309]|uniref:TetR/AcrR family transcriptional regulator n=1 Tax=Nocardiopsis sp. NRRL B-16309 TaxID=1519494 RepID=UPI0006B0648D|nr:TetR/AcrR family transcriptional regulator [Nocardiopsis sp. NRRL B-16309]
MSDHERDHTARGERTRRRIIDAAAELYSRCGFWGVTLGDVAERAGLTHGGVLHHFPSREAVLLHVLSRRDELDAPLLTAPGPDPRELVEVIVRMAEHDAGAPGPVSLHVTLAAEATDPVHPAHEYFVARYRNLRDHLVPALADLLDERDGPTPEIAAQQIVALTDGLRVQWLLDPGTVDMRAAVVSFLRSLGVAAQEPPGPGNTDTGGPDVGAR